MVSAPRCYSPIFPLSIKKKSLLFGNSYACFKLDLPTDTRTSPNSNRRLAVSSHSRPFTVKDKLGVTLKQTDEEQGEVVLLNSTYSHNTFGFTYAWWTAFNYERYVQSDHALCEDMEFVGQQNVYESVGMKIKKDLMEGNAVVLFAYGLSGSGKTFTVFGPDAADSPDAWFKHAEPHAMWGIFPHLAYDMFQERTDSWKFSMKYFQNVVDIVRDLMSPMGEERSFKGGMRKDQDGFMDITWCQAASLKTWDDLRSQFLDSNARKAISPTQFNHQSTRGHCIMTLEIDMPHPTQPGMKQRSRVYVCDLAGTEPAGDIFYAQYEKKTFPNGDVEYINPKPHKDQSKTKSLQDQGKKINLSLSEMAQFFMKMADLVKKKKLAPGVSVPGCNSYFLCKYLKDTMLQARTYLFCAIRPEVKYHPYTFATLGFAENASVIKLAPKKAQVAMSPLERKLMAQLEEMKKQMESMQGGGGDMAALLAAKQGELAKEMDGDGNSAEAQEAQLRQQADEYGRRGICLTHFTKDTKEPYFINLDEDPFRSNRFMYLLSKEVTVFGPGGDIKPTSLTILKGHCSVEHANSACTLVGGNGETIHNGKKIANGEKVPLKSFDRVVIGGELLLYRYPGQDPANEEIPSAADAVEEYQNCISNASSEQQSMLDEQMRAFQEEKDKWLKDTQNQKTEDEAAKEEHDRAMQAVDREILELLPKTKELKKIVGILDRDQLSFDVTLQRTEDRLGVPKVKIRVVNGSTDESIVIDPFEFLKSYSIVKDEMTHLSIALESGRDYEFPEHHDPLVILFDNTFQLGTCTIFPEYLIYGLSTDTDEMHQDIKNISAPYNNVGKLEAIWIPLEGPDAEEDENYLPEIDDPSDLIGKPWTYKLKIGKAAALPIITDMCYCQYNFNGELFTTETVSEVNTHNPEFTYEFVHHVDKVDQEFLDYLLKPMEIEIFVSPSVRLPKSKVSTTNEKILSNLQTGGSSSGANDTVVGGASAGGDEVPALKARIKELEEENASLKKQLSDAGIEPSLSKISQKLSESVKLDSELNSS